METQLSPAQKALAKAEAEQSIEEMFSSETSLGIMDTMSELAEAIVIEDEHAKSLERQLKDTKEQVDNMKTQLNELMMANNCAEGHKFDNGLFLKPYVKTDVFKAAGVTDDVLHEWLRANDLGRIIKETVWWTTLSATMKAEMEQGRSLPEIFLVANRPTVKFVGNGKVKFLACMNIIGNIHEDQPC